MGEMKIRPLLLVFYFAIVFVVGLCLGATWGSHKTEALLDQTNNFWRHELDISKTEETQWYEAWLSCIDANRAICQEWGGCRNISLSPPRAPQDITDIGSKPSFGFDKPTTPQPEKEKRDG